ncbi:MAG TPA: hypothetical protein VFT13_03690 [Candidatus Krumholzibacteria bacterium]|nr:hypothetical protein [Candidatus Krumholzibacteria bacterium]
MTVIGTVGSNQDATESAQVDANVARALTEQSIQSRAESVILSCEELNERHDNVTETLRKLRQAALRRARTPRERAAILANQRPTRLFIDALAPKRDCDARARELVPEAF